MRDTYSKKSQTFKDQLKLLEESFYKPMLMKQLVAGLRHQEQEAIKKIRREKIAKQNQSPESNKSSEQEVLSDTSS